VSLTDNAALVYAQRLKRLRGFPRSSGTVLGEAAGILFETCQSDEQAERIIEHLEALGNEWPGIGYFRQFSVAIVNWKPLSPKQLPEYLQGTHTTAEFLAAIDKHDAYLLSKVRQLPQYRQRALEQALLNFFTPYARRAGQTPAEFAASRPPTEPFSNLQCGLIALMRRHPDIRDPVPGAARIRKRNAQTRREQKR